MSRLYSFRSFLYILFSFTAIFALPATGAAQVGLGFNGTTQYVTTGITPSNSPLDRDDRFNGNRGDRSGNSSGDKRHVRSRDCSRRH
jgi:hypothetical protein